jgi:hypothetical protein
MAVELPVIAVAGRTRAGKTTLTETLGRRLLWPTTSFSSYVRATATARGLPIERQTLQDLGAEMIDEMGPSGFVDGALRHGGPEFAGPPFVIEGVRHLVTEEALRDAVRPTGLGLIFLAVSDRERDRRLAAEGVSPSEGRRWEEHSTEHDVLDGLESVADLVIDADRSKAFVADSAIAWVKGVSACSIRLPGA